MAHRTIEDDAWPAAAGEAFASMVRDRLAAEGVGADVSTEEYEREVQQQRSVWAVWISNPGNSVDLVCEVAEADSLVSVIDDNAEARTTPEALAYIVSRMRGQTRKQARKAARDVSRPLDARQSPAHTVSPDAIVAALSDSRPNRPSIESTVTRSDRGGRLRMQLTDNPGQWATVWVPDSYWLSVTVTGDHSHLIIDEDASPDEIRNYISQQVEVGVRYLLDQPPMQPVGRHGATRIAVTVGDQSTYLWSNPRSLRDRVAQLARRLTRTT